MAELISWQAIEERGSQRYEALSEPERVWFTTTRLSFSVRNGGLVSYYYNGYAEHIVDLIKSLEILEARQMLDLVHRMNALFSAMPLGFEATNEEIVSWNDDPAKSAESECIGELDLAAVDDLDARIEAFSKAHGIQV